MTRISLSGAYTAVRSAQGYLCASQQLENPSAACGSACGAGDEGAQPEPKPSACGSACGAGDK